jgi:hypothetical protein
MHLKRAAVIAFASLSLSAPVEETIIAQHANGRSVSAALFLELEEFARLCDITYCIGNGGLGITKPFQCLSRCTDFPSFELIKSWNTGPMMSDSCGYIALDHAQKRVIVAFRGTYSISSALVDLATLPQDYAPYPGGNPNEPKCEACSVHSGFQGAWANTQEIVMPAVKDAIAKYHNYKLHVAGHSLGGVMAGFAALDMASHGWDPIVTTFGEPRGGNKNFVKWFDDRFNLRNNSIPQEKLKYRRVTHIDDPVPQVPPTEFGFLMHAGEIFISKASLSPEITDLQHCYGDADKKCIAGQDSTVHEDRDETNAPPRRLDGAPQGDLLSSVTDELETVIGQPWGIPARFKLWNMLFAHRDYFWRFGICVPGGDPTENHSGKYDHLLGQQ